MDNNEMIIDKNAYKIMKYLYRHGEVRFDLISKNFGEDNACALFDMCRCVLVLHRLPNGSLTTDTSFVSFDSTFGLTPAGNKIVEERRKNNILCATPILLSIVSVLTSIVALLVSAFNSGNEFFIHLIK